MTKQQLCVICAGVLVILCAPSGVRSRSDFAIVRTSDDPFQYGYAIRVKDQIWLTGGPSFFRADGKVFSTLNHTVMILDTILNQRGFDELGEYNASGCIFQAGRATVKGVVKQYGDQPFLVFEQTYLNGANFTSFGDADSIISGFPNFQLKPISGRLGYLSYGGIMLADTDKYIGDWNTEPFNIRSGLHGGPLVLFDDKDNALVLSPLNQFMSASSWLSKTDMTYGWGIMGKVDALPIGFQYQTIIYYSSQGINQAMEGWGSILRKKYNKDLSYRENDLALNYLGYYTDNGAYYYQMTESGKNYEDTLLDVKQYSQKEGIPYKYLQMDCFWYHYNGSIFPGYEGWEVPCSDGTRFWRAAPDVLPHGLKYLSNHTGWPYVAHNMYWSSSTPYAKSNGGPFPFVTDVEKNVAIPTTEDFWDYLFAEAKSWGLHTYEQDFLCTSVERLDLLQSSLTLGRDWLMQMGTSAQKWGLTLQYCMSMARHGLQSLEIPVVTHARVSGDYHPDTDQWKIGISSIFADALGLAPLKDTFWTTTSQPGNPYSDKPEEHAPDLQAAVATLSTGPVAPSDKIGLSNTKLIMMTCNAKGLILKPSSPAKAIDLQIQELAFKEGSGPDGEVWTTYSNISGYTFGIIFAAGLTKEFKIGPKAAGFQTFARSGIYSLRYPSSPTLTTEFNEDFPLSLSGCGLAPFCLYYTTPHFTVTNEKDLMLIGEIDKFVPLSPQRFSRLEASQDSVTIWATGSDGETLNFAYFYDGHPKFISCLFSKSGSLRIVLPNGKCDV